MATVAQPAEVHLKSILMATDFSPASATPLRHALAIAQKFGAKFCLAHIVSSLGLTMAGPDAIFAAEEAARRDALEAERELAATAALAGIDHQVVVRHGVVWQELEEIIQSENVDLVVLGTHARHGFGKVVLGSVAEQIFRHAVCPVLTVGPACYREPRVNTACTFLYATDFSDASLQALPHAVAFANQFKAKLIFFHAAPVVLMPEDLKVYKAGDVTAMQKRAESLALQRLKTLSDSTNLLVKPECAVGGASEQSVAERILDAAWQAKADLIVLGLHASKRTGAAAHTLWSTAYEVVCGSECPILSVRST
jgi:nucleotide-binding universal stress UspA family protein